MIPFPRPWKHVTRKVRAGLIVATVLAGVLWVCPGNPLKMALGLTVAAIVTYMVLDAFMWFGDES